MTSLFPHPPYAEDQPYARTILYLHVMRASAMSFTFLSFFRLPISYLKSTYQGTPINIPALVVRTLGSSSRAFVAGSAVGAMATFGRMMGREEIEWKDRAWRIVENEGEKDTDWVVLGGAGAGAFAVTVVARRGAIPVNAGRAMLGGAGMGSGIGIPYMISTFARGRKQA